MVLHLQPSAHRPSPSDATGALPGGSFLQHVLLRGFQKVRHYGFLSPNSKIDFEDVRLLVWFFLGWIYWLASGHAPPERGADRLGCIVLLGAVPLRWLPNGSRGKHEN